MDSIRVSEALDSGSIPDEATSFIDDQVLVTFLGHFAARYIKTAYF
jgi:hypothetical protein